MNSALIFVCTDNVDPYLNALSYLYDRCGVTRFTFVFLSEVATEAPATKFVDDIIATLSSLADGEYGKHPVDVDERSKELYSLLAANLKSNPSLHTAIPLKELPTFLSKQTVEAKPDKLFIDITGLTKDVMAQVFSITIFLGYDAYAFVLNERPNKKKPELSLYFHLRPSDFHYHALSQEPTVQRIRRRLIPLPRIIWTAGIISAVSTICFLTLLLVDPSNIVLAITGLAANVIGIASGAIQALTFKAGHN